jgi:hypothetical protein
MLRIFSAHQVSPTALAPALRCSQPWSRTSRPVLLDDDREQVGSYDWANTTAFEGARVNELRKKQREPSTLPDAATMFSRFKERPGTFILIFLFGLLTIGDFIFNVSRAFICLLPDMCAPASY